MENLVNLYKPLGLSPLEAIVKTREKLGIANDVPMAFAGRLDPLAEGVLIILIGETCKKAKEYNALDKEYVAEILLGISTDTYDVLGMPQANFQFLISNFQLISNDTIQNTLNTLIERSGLHYPPYSSVPIGGKPAWTLARAGKIVESEMPKQKGIIQKSEVKSNKMIRYSNIFSNVEMKVEKVKGDFRQDEIVRAWQNLGVSGNKKFQVINVNITCTSGTYIRSIAHHLGKTLGMGAVLYSLKRTRVGEHVITNSVRLNKL